MKTEKSPSAKRPIKVAGYSHAKADARKEQRRREAESRQVKYDALNPDERTAHDAQQRRAYIYNQLENL